MNDYLRDSDEEPPSLSEEPPLSNGESFDRDYRIAHHLLLWDIPGRGQLLKRGIAICHLNATMGD